MSLEFLRPDPWQFCAFVSLNVKASFPDPEMEKRLTRVFSAKLKIAVDLDGDLAESMLVWCARVNREYGKRLMMEDLYSWSSWNKFSIYKYDFYRIQDESCEEWQA